MDIHRVVSRLEQVKEYQKYYSARCPYHEDNSPSLLVFKDGYFRCLSASCGRTGTLDILWRQISGWKSKPIVEHTSWYPPRLPDDVESFADQTHELLSNNMDTLGWYLKVRGIEGRILPARIGWYRGWYTMPIFNEDDSFYGVVMRAGKHIQDVTGMRYTTNRAPTMYVPDWHIFNDSDYLLFPFGVFDALAISELRFPVATSSSGLNINIDWFENIRKPIYFIPDRGEEDTAHDLAKAIGWRGRVLLIPYEDNKKDPADYMSSGRQMELMNFLRLRDHYSRR